MQIKKMYLNKDSRSTRNNKKKENKSISIKNKRKEPTQYHLKINKRFFKFTTGKKGELNILARDNVNSTWKVFKNKLIAPRKGYFDKAVLHFLDALLIKQGILVFYAVKRPYSIGAALFDDADFQEIKWRTANPIYSAQEKIEFKKLSKSKNEIKIDLQKGGERETLRFSLAYLFGNLFVPKAEQYFPTPEPVGPILERYENNPIIQPLLNQPWENCATFNAAAIYLNGRVHFLYRAIGNEGASVLGYAASHNGLIIDERSQNPVYSPREGFEFRREECKMLAFHYVSGGGWGGCEDPRLTKIDNTIYMTYTAFNGTNPPGVALTSISIHNFLNKKWNWRKAVLISPSGEIHKNWVVFPEKINGKFAILHSLSPEITIDYFDTLDFHDGDNIKSYHGQNFRDACWDNQMRGIGPPPIKTADGWLILYHAMDKNDPGKYKLGAMLLDYNNPLDILYRSPYPILEPQVDYENEGYKQGVIYCCGAVVINKRLFIYYGCADKSVSVATVNLNDFLNRLKKSPKNPIGLIIKKLR